MAIKPKSKPQTKFSEVEVLLKSAKHTYDPAKAFLVGVRGYYLDSMGKAKANDRGIYDDGIFLCTPDGFMTYNANADPSIYRKRVAVLKAGAWTYKLGIHGLSKPKSQQYRALVQADEVTVVRDQVGDDTGYFGINIHRGGYNSTSSLGCQTIYPEQWAGFIASVESAMKRYSQKTIMYYLV
jgi:hypothetical protein